MGRARRVDPDPDPIDSGSGYGSQIFVLSGSGSKLLDELQLEVKFNYNLIIKKIIAKIV